MTNLFDPPGADWQRIDPRYIKVSRISETFSTTLTIAIVSSILYWWLGWKWAAGFAAIWLTQGLISFWRAKRRVNAIGYAERGDDFCVVSGIWSRSLVMVPYGRIQLVEVTDGPLLRRYGLANVSISTASVGSSPELEGLSRSDAEALRDRLMEKAETRESGI